MKNLLVATINESMGNGRITIVCRRDKHGKYRWFCPANDDLRGEATEDTEVSAYTLSGAKQAALDSWGSKDWDLRATWAR